MPRVPDLCPSQAPYRQGHYWAVGAAIDVECPEFWERHQRPVGDWVYVVCLDCLTCFVCHADRAPTPGRQQVKDCAECGRLLVGSPSSRCPACNRIVARRLRKASLARARAGVPRPCVDCGRPVLGPRHKRCAPCGEAARRETLRAASKTYRLVHHAKARASSRGWWRRNAEEAKARKRAWGERNKERVRAYNKRKWAEGKGEAA